MPALAMIRLSFMRFFTLSSFLTLIGLLMVIHPAIYAQSTPNSDPAYQSLRNLALGNESFTVSNFDLKRDVATFHLRSGTVCFVAPVQGKITGAVFIGDGNLVIDAPLSERSMLKLLTKENDFSENFSQLVLRFTDSTYEEIKKNGSTGSGGCDAALLKDSQRTTRTILKDNLEARLLQDVLSPELGGYFRAFIRGKRYSDKELLTIDPHQGREQINFMTYADSKAGEWASFPMFGAHKVGTVGNPTHILHQEIDTSIENNGNLTGKATTNFVAQLDGLRVVPFKLFPSLRVQSVTADGQTLSFIQEDKKEDAEFNVILAKPLAAGDSFTITCMYSGKDAVSNEGGGNYYPVSREDWFPNNPN